MWIVLMIKTKNLKSWHALNATIANQVQKKNKGKLYTYNVYSFSLNGSDYQIESEFGSTPPQGHIGDSKSILFNGSNRVLPNYWFIRNVRTIATVLIALYWPFWFAMDYFGFFEIF
jgi:hypothetical protein